MNIIKNYDDTILNQSFFDRPAEIVASELLGKYIVRVIDGTILVGKIVEVEAYLGSGDAAAHNARGMTKSNQSLFSKPGIAYVHRMRQHCLIDVVTKIPSSVLIRAIKPIQGVDYMKQQRGQDALKGLTDGPGKVCKALHIIHLDDGINVTDPSSTIVICDLDSDSGSSIEHSTRIGITKDKHLPLRFSLTC